MEHSQIYSFFSHSSGQISCYITDDPVNHDLTNDRMTTNHSDHLPIIWGKPRGTAHGFPMVFQEGGDSLPFRPCLPETWI